MRVKQQQQLYLGQDNSHNHLTNNPNGMSNKSFKNLIEPNPNQDMFSQHQKLKDLRKSQLRNNKNLSLMQPSPYKQDNIKVSAAQVKSHQKSYSIHQQYHQNQQQILSHNKSQRQLLSYSQLSGSPQKSDHVLTDRKTNNLSIINTNNTNSNSIKEEQDFFQYDIKLTNLNLVSQTRQQTSLSTIVRLLIDEGQYTILNQVNMTLEIDASSIETALRKQFNEYKTQINNLKDQLIHAYKKVELKNEEIEKLKIQIEKLQKSLEVSQMNEKMLEDDNLLLKQYLDDFDQIPSNNDQKYESRMYQDGISVSKSSESLDQEIQLMSKRLLEVNQSTPTLTKIQQQNESNKNSSNANTNKLSFGNGKIQHNYIDISRLNQGSVQDGKVEILSQRTKRVEEQLMKEIEILKSLRDEQASSYSNPSLNQPQYSSGTIIKNRRQQQNANGNSNIFIQQDSQSSKNSPLIQNFKDQSQSGYVHSNSNGSNLIFHKGKAYSIHDSSSKLTSIQKQHIIIENYELDSPSVVSRIDSQQNQYILDKIEETRKSNTSSESNVRYDEQSPNKDHINKTPNPDIIFISAGTANITRQGVLFSTEDGMKDDRRNYEETRTIIKAPQFDKHYHYQDQDESIDRLVILPCQESPDLNETQVRKVLLTEEDGNLNEQTESVDDSFQQSRKVFTKYINNLALRVKQDQRMNNYFSVNI
ncbi:UNKNOWN [Stylonychia lemnae]|uniref:Uncharacterized protein n=1 Tax=Stylonychia lemnae TaxID=5949 RepID=A0A078AX30_STYLE|nr:UNKNOWN [Stylonychia lemnae]|eukprot:CDW86724.1 UNKNOWN [Stylonychia lemnae]